MHTLLPMAMHILHLHVSSLLRYKSERVVHMHEIFNPDLSKMSSEIPLYALVDKSRRNNDEPGTVANVPLYALVDKSRKNCDEPGTVTGANVLDTEPLRFPARDALIKKRPLVSHYKSDDKIEDGGENETAGGVNTPNPAKSKYYTIFAIIGAVIASWDDNHCHLYCLNHCFN